MVVTVTIPVAKGVNITRVIGAFQTITYSIHNDKMPIRCVGNMNAKRYVFGPRTIAGTIILTVFDRHWIREMLDSYNKLIKAQGERYFLTDELPAFDLTISAANEYGHNAKLALYGVTIVNEGQVMSINDVYTENTYQFYATNVEYLERVDQTTRSQKTSVKNIPIKGITQENVPSGNSKKATAKLQDNTVQPEKTFDPTSPSDILELIKDKEKLAAYIINLDKDADKKARDALQQIIDKRLANQMTDEEAATAINKWENDEDKRRYDLFCNKVYNPITTKAIKDFENNKITEQEFAVVKDALLTQDTYFTISQNVFDKVGDDADVARNTVNTTKMRGSSPAGGMNITPDPSVWKYIKPTSNDEDHDSSTDTPSSTYTAPQFTGIGTAAHLFWISDALSESNAYTNALDAARQKLAQEHYDTMKYKIVSQSYNKDTHEYTIVIEPVLST